MARAQYAAEFRQAASGRTIVHFDSRERRGV